MRRRTARLRRPRRLPVVLAALALAMAAGIAGSVSTAAASPASSAPAHGGKPTIVLVHGAWADSSSRDAATG